MVSGFRSVLLCRFFRSSLSLSHTLTLSFFFYIYICLWVSLWSTFFQFAGQSLVHIFFSKIGAASSITISSLCSRYKPMKNNSGAGQSVVHPLVSLWSTFLTTYPSKMWTIDWPGGGPETDLQFYQTRPPKGMIFSNTKHYKKWVSGHPPRGEVKNKQNFHTKSALPTVKKKAGCKVGL